MNQVLQAHVFLSCLLSMILSPSWAVGEDWKLTFDQLSSHEMSFRIVVNADGKIAAFTKQRKSKEFEETIIATLSRISIASLRDRVVAMPSRFQQAAQDAAILMEPKVTFVSVPRRTLKTEPDIDLWLQATKLQLLKALEKGPVGVQ